MRTPTAFHHPARGCALRATLGQRPTLRANPERVASRPARPDATPLGLARFFRHTQGRRSCVAPTLGWRMERRWRSGGQTSRPVKGRFAPLREPKQELNHERRDDHPPWLGGGDSIVFFISAIVWLNRTGGGNTIGWPALVLAFWNSARIAVRSNDAKSPPTLTR